MRRRHVPVVIGLVMLALAGLAPVHGYAAPVGAVVQVEGSVELMKQGKLPAIPVKVQDQVEPRDIIRTKSKSRAQVRFVDDTVLTIAPATSLTIEEYLYDGARGSRKATLQVMRGLVYTVVNRVYQTEQPDFMIKTHTAVLGVRGTRFFVLRGLRYTAFFQEAGKTQIQNILPTIAQRVMLVGQQHTIVKEGKPPLAARRLLDADLVRLRKWLVEGVPERFLQLDPIESLWEGLPGGVPPMPQGPDRLPEGLFKPPELTPQTPRHSPSGPSGPL